MDQAKKKHWSKLRNMQEICSQLRCYSTRSPIACMSKSFGWPFSHKQGHNLHLQLCSCWLLSFISLIVVNVAYTIGGGMPTRMPSLWKMYPDRCLGLPPLPRNSSKPTESWLESYLYWLWRHIQMLSCSGLHLKNITLTLAKWSLA